MKVVALIDYNDYELKRKVIKGEVLEVSNDRANVLLKGNVTSNNKPFVKVLEELETTTNEPKLETADKKIKRKSKKVIE